MNIYLHFNELKLRLFYYFFSFFLTFIISYLKIDVFLFLMSKLIKTNFVFIDLFEGLFCFFFSSLFLTCFFSLFIVLYSIFDFVKSGLTKNEKKIYIFFIKTEFIINCFCLFFSYKFFVPCLINFLLSFEQSKNEHFFNFFFQARLFDFVLIFFSIFYLVFFLFQLPFVVFVCVQFKLVKFNFFVQRRREFILIFFLLGCFFSPPDLCSQFLLAFPCFFVYEFIIFVYIFLANIFGELLEKVKRRIC